MDNEFATGYALGQNDSNSNSGGLFGGDGSWLWIIVVFALLFGWGGNGGGMGGGNGGGWSGVMTRTAVADGFALNGLENGIRGVQQGLCDGFYAMNTGMLNGFNGVNTAMMQGFNGIQGQLCNMSAQSAACCCETQRLLERGFADTNYNMATQACDTRNTINTAARDIIENQNANYRAIMDHMTQDKIATLTAENQSLKFAASQAAQNNYLTAMSDAQTAELIRRIHPAPVPAYSVPAPYPYCGPVAQNYGGCGCGCGIAA